MLLRTPSRRVAKRTRGIAHTEARWVKIFRSFSKRQFAVTKSEIFALILLPRAITLGLNLVPASPEFISVADAQEPVTIKTALVLDVTQPTMPLRFNTKTPLIEKSLSRDEEERNLAQKAIRFNTTQNVTQNSAVAEPDLATKRALVQEIAVRHGIDWRLLESVWQIESGKAWKTYVKSSAGAQGPMQFMPGTWRRYATSEHPDTSFAPDALEAGAKLLASNGAAQGNIEKALFAYNHADWYVRKVKKIMDSI